jgi:predicted ATPase
MASISVRNLGPVRSSELEISPLTVLIGPNSVGKSFMATLCYASLSKSPVSRYQRLLGRRLTLRRVLNRQRMEELRPLAEQSLATLADSKQFRFKDIPPVLEHGLTEAVESSFRLYANEVSTEIERCFGSKIEDLTRTNQGRRMPASVSLSSTSPSWRLDVRLGRTKLTSKLIWSKNVRELLDSAAERRRDYLVNRLQYLRSEQALEELVNLLITELFVGFPAAVHYLPAARSGILNSHRALASFVVSRSSLAGIEDMRIPKMSGVVADFISRVIEITPSEFERGNFSEVARSLERSVLHGSVKVTSTSEGYPEFSFLERGQRQIPLHRTSSMVSELAPIVLYLRYFVRSHDLLLIEEPEAHLHPGSQLLLAQSIVGMVRSGLKVLITTHSDYFLHQLNNSLMAGVIEDRHGEVDVDIPTLESRDVMAYLFERFPDGTHTRELGVSKTGEISDEDFAKVSEALYSETVKLDRRLTREDASK